MSDFEIIQALMARQAIANLMEQHALVRPSLNEVAAAVDMAVAPYISMLESGRISTQLVVVQIKKLADHLAQLGLDHDHFMELIKSFMVLGYYAGCFGVYIDAGLAANRQGGAGGVRGLPALSN